MIKNAKFISNLEDYNGRVPRIEGFKKLKEAGLPFPEPVVVVNPHAFNEYRRKGITKRLQKEIEAAFFEIRNKNPRKGIFAGRAYFVPGLESPPGPRTSSIKEPTILIKEIQKIFDFAIKNKFDKKGAEISAFLHPFINPKVPLGGGCVTGEGYDGKKGILIEAIYGNDEGVQTFPHDDYLVDPEKNRFIQKVIHYKAKCLSATSQLEYKTVTVPRKLRNAQVLADEIILKIARHYRKMSKIYRPHRLEFNALKGGVFFTEATPYTKKESTESVLQFSGKVVRVKTLEDINKIKQTNRIVFVDPQVIKSRNMDLLTCLACNLPDKKVILYPGTTSTAHASIIFREMGHTVVYVGHETYHDDEEVVVKVEEGELTARRQLLI